MRNAVDSIDLFSGALPAIMCVLCHALKKYIERNGIKLIFINHSRAEYKYPRRQAGCQV